MAEMIEHAASQARLSSTDVLLVTIAEVEANAVLRVFPISTICHIGDQTYHDLGTIGQARICMVQSEMGSGGQSGAMLTIREAIAALQPSAIIMVGIAFGVDQSKQRIGDILVSKQIVDYELQRVGKTPDHTSVIIPRGDRPSASPRMLSRFRAAAKCWSVPPRIQFGLILSGAKLVDNQDFRDQLLHVEPEAIGGEMEGAGLYAAAQRNKVDWIVVKAICDWADGNKAQRKQSRQKKVAEKVAQFILQVLQQGGFTESHIGSEETLERGQTNTNQRGRLFPSIWNVPFSPNLYFTGREDILTRLHETLTSDKLIAITQPQAMNGLGGIGKTQTAIKYAYLHSTDYQAVVWVHADSRESLINDYFGLADLLNLPKQQEDNPEHMIIAVKRWFQTHHDWLLIFDNVEDLELVSHFFPSACTGHILLTTRQQATGTVAQPIRLDTMLVDEGAFFLLRRAKIVSLDDSVDRVEKTDREQAREISRLLGGLPLALDQAGAYIEETRCGLTDYLELYQQRQADLLIRRGIISSGHPDSVTVTFSLSFERVKMNSQVAAELLQFCAFLHPDTIPMEIIKVGWALFGSEQQSIASNLFEQNTAIGELLKYSLLYRDAETNMLTIHRLVQDVIKHSMNQDMQQQWAERVVKAVDHTFPQVDYSSWTQCQRYLPHAQVCTTWIKQWQLTVMEAISLLHKTVKYLFQRGRYGELDQPCQQLFGTGERVLGYGHPDIITIINDIAGIYRVRGNFAKAEQFYKLALHSFEYVKNITPLHVAHTLNDLGVLYSSQKRYFDAQPLLLQALAIRLQELDPENREVAQSLNDLALVYKKQGRFTEAELLYMPSLAIRERLLGRVHRAVAESLNNIGLLHKDQKKYARAEQYYLQALRIKEQLIEPDHPEMATIYFNLASVYDAQGKHIEARKYYERALDVSERKYGPDYPLTKSIRKDYEKLLKNQEN